MENLNVIFLGLLLVTISGLGTGTIAWPLKKSKAVRFEYFLFTYILIGIICIPWIVMLIGIDDFYLLVSQVGVKPLLISNALSISWGIANIIYLICVIRIGAAVTGAILTSLGMSVGVIMPLVFRGGGMFSHSPTLFSHQGAVILLGLIILLIGVLLTSRAGYAKEKSQHLAVGMNVEHRHTVKYGRSVAMVALAGVLSAGISLAFVYSQDPILKAVKAQGGSEVIGNFSVWALSMLGGALVNVGYGIYLMIKRGSWKSYSIFRTEVLFGFIAGAQFILSIVLMGRGMLLMGALGASVGFAVQQSTQILGNQLVGFLSGEWKHVSGRPLRTMYISVTIIIIGIIVVSFSNSLS